MLREGYKRLYRVMDMCIQGESLKCTVTFYLLIISEKWVRVVVRWSGASVPCLLKKLNNNAGSAEPNLTAYVATMNCQDAAVHGFNYPSEDQTTPTIFRSTLYQGWEGYRWRNKQMIAVDL